MLNPSTIRTSSRQADISLSVLFARVPTNCPILLKVTNYHLMAIINLTMPLIAAIRNILVIFLYNSSMTFSCVVCWISDFNFDQLDCHRKVIQKLIKIESWKINNYESVRVVKVASFFSFCFFWFVKVLKSRKFQIKMLLREIKS